MSPTLFKWKAYRFFFLSREEERMHVHVGSADGEAKFWLEPTIELVKSHGLRSSEVRDIERVVEEHKDEIKAAWLKHFRS